MPSNDYNSTIVCPNIIVHYLNKYLNEKKWSANQISSRWNISNAMLSQIRSGKKSPGIELGLKILREGGATIEEKKEWVYKKTLNSSKEGRRIIEESNAVEVEKNLQKDFCRSLEDQPILVDIFLDVALAEKVGVSRSSIIKNYGEYGFNLALSMQESDIFLYKNNKMYINEVKANYITDGPSSFGIVKSIIESQRLLRLRGQFKGNFFYDVTDISEEAFEKLLVLNNEYNDKARELLDSSVKHRFAGGLRVVCQSLVSVTKE